MIYILFKFVIRLMNFKNMRIRFVFLRAKHTSYHFRSPSIPLCQHRSLQMGNYFSRPPFNPIIPFKRKRIMSTSHIKCRDRASATHMVTARTSFADTVMFKMRNVLIVQMVILCSLDNWFFCFSSILNI